MRLSWAEIRRRAKEFSEEWKDAYYEKGETQSFYDQFFDIFGINRRRVAVFEKKIEMIDQNRRGFIDLFWPSVLLVEQKSAGKDLLKAEGQALDYVLGLNDRQQPKFVLTCDFQRFRLLELDTRKEVNFTLPELHKYVEEFGFMVGVQRRTYGQQTEVSIKAAELLGKLHDALDAKNYRGIDLERIMVRLLFCMFADDTGIFESKDDFLYLIEERTDEDGGNVGRVLNHVFEILDTPEDQRLEGDDPELTKFPYVNGDLFKGAVRTAPFDKQMREDLLDCCRFDWGAVSPAIFGSLFQSVMDKKERRKKGAHYTTEPNIKKVIEPLFFDDLRVEFERLKERRDGGKRAALIAFQEKLSGLNFFDPACGCGNFLVVTYRELRRLEQETLELIHDVNSPQMLDVEALSKVKLDQFYGIELAEFPAHIAEVAMWMTEHLANIELGRTFGKVFADIPLNDSATIVHGDALEVDWQEILPAGKCFAVMGNPPFIGQSYQSKFQREQMARIIDAPNGRAGSLDYVGAWFLKAGAYAKSALSPLPLGEGPGVGAPTDETASNPSLNPSPEGEGDFVPPRIGFVSTNSITQGEQVAQLWPILFDRYQLEIDFAHRTFAWGSDAKGKAAVHVVIIGLAHRDHERAEKRLFSYDDVKGEPDETRHRGLSAYLFGLENTDRRHRIVNDTRTPISAPKQLRMGSKVVDGGNLIIAPDEKTGVAKELGERSRFLRPFIGSKDFIQGGHRWILALQEASPADLRVDAFLAKRVAAVRSFRAESKKAATRKLADYPTEFEVTTVPNSPFLVIPEVSSERRNYVPIGWLEPPTIPSNLIHVFLEATKSDFAILTSCMHMAWLSHIGGRLESRYRYSIGLVYNTFPWPDISDKQRDKIEKLAQDVLDAREEWPTSSLADLYDPDTMPANLRKAHRALDKAVDELYRKKPFESDRDRVEHLFGLYEKLVNPIEADAEKQNKRVARNRKRRKGKG